MVEITLHIDRATLALYQRVAETVCLPLEQVLSDALFKLAGELALESLGQHRTIPG